MRGRGEQLEEVEARGAGRRAAGERERVLRAVTAGRHHHAVGTRDRPRHDREVHRGGPALVAARHVDVADDDVHQLQRPAVVPAVLVPLRATAPVETRRAVRQLDAVDRDGAADLRGLAELARDAPQPRGRDRRDALDGLRRIAGGTLLEKVERGLHPLAAHGELAFERRGRERRVVVRLHGAGRGVVQARLSRAVAQVAAVGADEVGRVRARAQELRVVDASLVEEDVQHPEAERRVGSRTDRQPLVGLRRRVVADRIDHDELHAAVDARRRAVRDAVIEALARRDALLRAHVDEVVAVREVDLVPPPAGRQVLDGVDRLAAGARDARLVIGRSEHRRERAQPRGEVAVGPGLQVQLARVVVDDAPQTGGDRVDRDIPGDLLPARIDADALLGIRPPHRMQQALAVVVVHDPGLALRAHAAAVAWRVGVPDDVEHAPVLHANEHLAGDEAHAAGGRDPVLIRSGPALGAGAVHDRVLGVPSPHERRHLVSLRAACGYR